jgi:hypothetical protein
MCKPKGGESFGVPCGSTMEFDSVDYQVPSHWLSGLVNGEETSFDYYGDDADYQAYLSFMEHEVRNAIVEVISDESYFCKYHDARGYGVLACDVVDCIFHFPVVATV